jgi:DNA repair exonuclease SbcCD nuclease subunit
MVFVHTADWQVGAPHARVEDAEKRALVRHERVALIARLGEFAREQGAAFVVVAGDLFDSPRPDQATVSAACSAIGRLGLPVYAIPGNHDHGGPDSLWEQPFFLQERAALAPNLHVLLRPEPLELEQAVLLPCPLLRRHELQDTSAWLRSLDFRALGPKPRIVLAHGSVQDFGPAGDDDEADGANNRLELDRLPLDEIDYIALGDWHGLKQVGPKAWYAGTPEPDRFPRNNEPGHVLAVTIERGTLARVEALKTGHLRWHNLEFDFTADSDLSRLDERLSSLTEGKAGEDLVRLTLRGSLGMTARAALEQRLDTWRARLLRMRLHDQVLLTPNAEELQTLTQRNDAPLAARIAARLLEESRSSDPEIAATALAALRELHAAV